jgi:hypothetical protein
MQSFSGFDFLIKYTYSDSSSHADYEYHLIFSINWSPHREKCKILRRCQNSRKILLMEKQRFILYPFVCRSYQCDFRIPHGKLSLEMLSQALSYITCPS